MIFAAYYCIVQDATLSVLWHTIVGSLRVIWLHANGVAKYFVDTSSPVIYAQNLPRVEPWGGFGVCFFGGMGTAGSSL